MLVRVIALAGAITLSASAQTPPAPISANGVCQQIATAAFEANRNIGIYNTREERSAPFVSKWLVQRALATDTNGVLRQIGRREKCEDLSESCRYLDAYQLVDDPAMDIPGRQPASQPIPPELNNYVEWNDSVGLLPLNGDFLDIRALSDFGYYSSLGPTGAFVKSALDSRGLACAFDNRLHETYSADRPGEETPETCAALLSDGSEVLQLDPNIPAGITRDTFRDPAGSSTDMSSPFSGSGTFVPDGILKIDIDGDGADETLVHILWSGSGDRCQLGYFDVLDSSDPSKLSAAPVRSLIQGIFGTTNRGSGGSCRSDMRIRRAGQRILFEYSALDPVLKRGEPVVTKAGGPLERVLREIKGGKVRHLCSTRFAIEPVVVYAR